VPTEGRRERKGKERKDERIRERGHNFYVLYLR
jgi:hypothetical protein